MTALGFALCKVVWHTIWLVVSWKTCKIQPRCSPNVVIKVVFLSTLGHMACSKPFCPIPHISHSVPCATTNMHLPIVTHRVHSAHREDAKHEVITNRTLCNNLTRDISSFWWAYPFSDLENLILFFTILFYFPPKDLQDEYCRFSFFCLVLRTNKHRWPAEET